MNKYLKNNIMRKNYIKQLFIALAVMLCSATAGAYEIVVDDIYYKIISEDELTVSVENCNKNLTGDVVIPSTVTYNGKEYKVVEILNYACKNVTGITSVTIPGTVESIGYSAFAGCTAITSVTLGDGVVSIEQRAFDDCTSLANIVVPATVTRISASLEKTAWYNSQPDGPLYLGNVFFEYKGGVPENTSVKIKDGTVGIAYGAFENEYNLTSIDIPNSVKAISTWAFYTCKNLTSVKLPNSLTYISNSVFANCSSLANIEIPSSVTSIGNGAFENCTSFTSIDIPNSVISIGNSVFKGCTNLANITIPNSVVSMGDNVFTDTPWYNNQPNGELYVGKILYAYKGDMPAGTSINVKEGTWGIAAGAFINCVGLASIDIPNSVTTIGYSAFSGCTGLSAIEIPDSVTSIGTYAFSKCTGLTTIKFPNTVTEIGDGALYGCNSLTSIYMQGTTPPVLIGNSSYPEIVAYTQYENITLYVPRTALDAYKNADGWKNLKNIVGYGPLRKKDIFEADGVYYKVLYESPLRVAVTYKGDYVSEYSNEYSGAVVIPSTVICENDTCSVIYIDMEAFEGCTGLTSVEISNSVTGIDYRAFYGCTSLTSVTISSNLIDINANAFVGCDNLASIYLNGKTPASAMSNAFTASHYSNTTVYVPRGSLETYKAAHTWKDFANIVEHGPLAVGTTFEVDSICYKVTSDSLITVEVAKLGSTNGSAYTGDVVIPAAVTYDGVTYSVTGIGDKAFYGCTGLTSVDIPNSVTSIGKSAFYRCSALTSIVIPNGVKTIESNAFRRCEGLTSVVIGNGVTTIGDYAFESCSSLKDLYIEDGETTLALGYNASSSNKTGQGLFYDCPLENVYIGRNLSYETSKKYGYSPFYEKATLKSLTIGDNVTSIENKAFYGCSALTSLVIGNGVTSIGDDAFYGCSALTSLVIGNSVTTIGYYAFAGCSALTSATIGSSVTSIGNNAFNGCSALTSLEIPNSVKTIGLFAFYGCAALTSLEIPNSVTFIDELAFSDCSSLANIVVAEGNSAYDSRNNCNAVIETATNTLVVGCKNSVFPSGITSIGAYAFYGSTAITSIDIPAGVTSIGVCAFNGCTGLTSIEIPDGVTSIGSRMFYGCSALASIDIPNSVTSIGSEAFSGCSSLASIDIPNSVTSIDWGVFYGCTSLTSIEIPDSVTGISDEMFSGCSALASIEIPNSVTYIDAYAFYDCTSLASIEIPNSVTNINRSAFQGCSSLTSVRLPESLLFIENKIFYGCDSLTSIYATGTTPAIVYATGGGMVSDYTTITLYVPRGSLAKYQATAGWSDFTNIVEYGLAAGDVFTVDGISYRVTSDSLLTAEVTCKANESSEYGIEYADGYSGAVVIPDAVSCEGLTYSVTAIGESAFAGCTALTSVEIPASVTRIDMSAFVGCSSLTNVNLTGSTPPVLDNGSFADSQYADVVVRVPDDAVDAYKAADAWKEFKNIVGSDVTFIEQVEDDATAFEATAGGLVLTAADGKPVAVYSINGALVEKIDRYAGEEITLEKGVYILRVGSVTVKVKM